ncbi:phage holin family protein [Thermomonas sp.]|uniref:phage holin family protein n=1 Tax=Thermomonas sp. TaxID=1971895 RepID=UPI0035B3A286
MSGDEQAANAAESAALGDTLQQLGEGARASAHASLAALLALRRLLAADLALAWAALGHGLVFAGLAIALGGAGWLLLMAALVAGLQQLGLSWLLALLVAATLSLAGTLAAAWAALRHFRHTHLQATRRQLAQWAQALPDALRNDDGPGAA